MIRLAPIIGRTVVVAETVRDAVVWCQANGVPPRGRRTVIVTPGNANRAVRGLHLGLLDRVEHVRDFSTHEIDTQLRIARMR